MVTTRSSGAPEPLERLTTPPKRSRKPQPPISPVREASPEMVTSMPMDVPPSALPCVDMIMPRDFESLTPPPEPTPSNQTSTKRRHDEVEAEGNPSPSKRTRTEPTTPAQDDDYLFMFPKKHSLEEEEMTLSEPPKTLADTFRRNRYLRTVGKKNARTGSVTRRKAPMKLDGDNPFGFETFTPQELAAQMTQEFSRDPSVDRSQREERSAAPEPETPRRGLFGSLRDLGSATIGRVLSPFAKSNPPQQSATAPPVRSEPPRKPVRVWDIQYPEIEPAHDENTPPESFEYEETEADRRRRTFESKHGKTNRKFDHLHTLPRDGDSDSLPYPLKTADSRSQRETNEAGSPTLAEFAKRRKEIREKRFGKRRAEEPPSQAPLFGPNSHYARGTKNPVHDQFSVSGDHPAMKKRTGDKRKLNDALPEEAAAAEKTPSKTFHPYVEDESEAVDAAQDAPSTPLAKKQKTTDLIQTPRSALKAPGTIGRSGRSARFNDNPVASVKRMSPISGSAPAGEFSPNNLFNTFDADRMQEDSPSSNTGLTPSPNTMKNTLANTGQEWKKHPGDKLTETLNNGAQYKRTEYLWKDPQNPDWRPSLNNPRPGEFRFVPEEDEDEEIEMLAEVERNHSSTSPDPAALSPPSTPRMSHAELPKLASASGTPGADSASAFEAANLERRRADAAKTKPRKSSRLAEVTSARSRSPSPPGLDSSFDAGDASDASAKTPSPTLETANAIWTWSPETNEYISSDPRFPDFAYNPHNELTASFAMKSSTGTYDNTVTGPDNMTELSRQNHYKNKYDAAWAAKTFQFDAPQTYEEAGVGSKYVHDLVRKNDARYPDVVKKCDERFALEWDAHQEAIENAHKEGKRLVATYPDRDGIEMLDADEEL